MSKEKMMETRKIYPLTWEERIQWVMKNTDVELENFYIVEEVYKPTTPTHRVITQVADEIFITYERISEE